MNIFIVHHEHELPSGFDDVKLIGVYLTEYEAEEAVKRSKLLPGFCEVPDGFSISSYEVGKDHWTEGYFTWIPEDDSNDSA